VKRKVKLIVVFIIILLIITVYLYIDNVYLSSKNWTRYSIKITNATGENYIVYIPLIIRNNKPTEFSNQIDKEYDVIKSINTEYGGAFSISCNKDFSLFEEIDKKNFDDELSMRNESDHSIEWSWSNPDLNEEIWIYCSGLKENKSMYIRMSLSQGTEQWNPKGYMDGTFHSHRIYTYIKNGWNLVTLYLHLDAYG